MVPNGEPLGGDLEAAKKRKRDGAEDRDDRKALKRQKSKTKTKRRSRRNGDESLGDQLDSTVARRRDAAPTKVGSADLEEASSSWKVSKPLGGRMLDIDPIFSADEEHLLVIYNTSIQVYSTVDSLLVRRIPLPLSATESDEASRSTHIVTANLSRISPNLVWVASSNGFLWCIDWTTGAGLDAPFALQVKRVLDMAVGKIRVGEAAEDVIYVLEKTSHSGGRVIVHNRGSLESQGGIVLHTCDDSPHLLRSAKDSSVVLVATNYSIHAGVQKRKGKDIKRLDDLQYQFFSFNVEDQVTTIDVRLAGGPGRPGARSAVDLVVGCARGAILILNDLLGRFPGADEAASRKGLTQPRKLHWHPRAVHSVKWSRDGNYLISGGSETVLVQWQLDTGRKSFLPHLSASIENIVVSPRGSSYAVHLDDNSVMVLSTAELEPTTYISGIQTFVFSDGRPKDSLVQRVWQEPEELSASIPAVSSPLKPSHLLICTGHGQKSTLADGNSFSAPYLQVFDLESSQSVSKQAVARANPTESAITIKGHPILEPTVTKITFSHDGRWLATVDEWQPPERDLDPLLDGSTSAADVSRGRREIYLKFWEVDPSGTSFQLASRINEAHFTNDPAAVLGLTSDPSSTRFATVGADGVARIWSPRLRQRDGLAAAGPKGEELWRWACAQAVALETSVSQGDEIAGLPAEEGSERVGGALSFSEDGSTLFVAYGRGSDAVLYIVDAESGEIRDKLFGMFTGDIKDLKTVSSCLILLSDDLKVYNIVSDELQYGVNLKKWYKGSCPLLQLATDRQSNSFAIAIPITGQKQQEKAKRGDVSELIVFSLDDSKPRLTQTFSHLITILVPSALGSGFVAVDSAAQVWSVSLGSELQRLAQPLADIQLDQGAAAPASRPNGVGEATDDDLDNAASVEDMRDADADADVEADDDGEDDFDAHPAVIAPQRLAEIFNAGPAFAMPPIESTFYQVAELLASKPKTVMTSSA